MLNSAQYQILSCSKQWSQGSQYREPTLNTVGGKLRENYAALRIHKNDLTFVGNCHFAIFTRFKNLLFLAALTSLTQSIPIPNIKS